jgi:hypothetical protein
MLPIKVVMPPIDIAPLPAGFSVRMLTAGGAAVPMRLVRGLDTTTERVFHAFGPAGLAAPEPFRIEMDTHPASIHIEFEVERDGFGTMRFRPPWVLPRLNN